MTVPEPFVIVGGGQAGAWVARTLRKEGFAGRIVLIAEEKHWPYEQPGLSKTVLQGVAAADSLTLLGRDQAAALAVECWLGQMVTEIDRTARRVTCASGVATGYGTLFITTGGRVRTLPWLNGVMSERIHTLRTQADAERLQAGLRPGATLLVVGGGWIGLEVAATARGLGVAVTVVETGARLCARTMPSVVSGFLLALHRTQGVEFAMGAMLADLHATADKVVARLADGTLTADQAVIGIGIKPETHLAEACGLVVDDGIVVDRQGRTSDPVIFAAGDVARHPNAFAGASLRLETWANAQNAAIIAARASLGQDVSYAEVPWFWSDQYGRNIQALGLPGDAVRSIVRGSPQDGAGCWLLLDAEDRFAGAVAVDAPRELRTVRKMLAAGSHPMPEDWADTSMALARVRSAGATVPHCAGSVSSMT